MMAAMSTGLTKDFSLFEGALPITDPDQRSAFLEQACAGDAALLARMNKLLAAHGISDRFFAECNPNLSTKLGPASGVESNETRKPLGDLAGTQIGRYKLLRPLGEGGCGVVYLAEQQEPIRRQVALKVIKLGMDTKRVIARFEAERQALALMDHPNIARVFDAGATDTGRPYFVMELVQGVKITTYCDENHLDSRRRLDLFIQVCQAIQHAHQKGVIHRDIKPSNIPVTVSDGVPVPKVIDFGIAKAIEGRLTRDTEVTSAGQFVGTPAYMSPEQAEMSGLDVDTRSDIYSLGVVLYELLTGRTPFDQATLLGAGLDEMRRTLREKEPQRPSTMLTSMGDTDLTVTATRRQAEAPRLIKSLKGDLDWVVMKALEKDRRRRYETATALAADVQRYLNNEPVVARPPSRWYRLQKLVQRNKVVYACGAMVAVTLVLGFGASTSLYLKEREARFLAERARTNEMQLRQEAETREKVTQAAVLLSHGATEQADALVDSIPARLLSPSTEAAGVFHTLGEWNMFQAKWEKAAARYAVLVQVNQVDKADQTAAATVDLLRAAPLLIETGDLLRYERIRRVELERLAGTSNPNAAEQLIKVSLLLPADDSTLKLIAPLARVTADSLRTYDPKMNGGWYLAAWRSYALALFEFRQGNYMNTLERLAQCSGYPDQSPSCAASAHLLRGLAYQRLGRIKEGNAEVEMGRTMIENRFRRKIDGGDNTTGLVEGWLMAPIFLHEADGRPMVLPGPNL